MPKMGPKSRGIACALAFFLGGFGGQWYYLERPGRGILYFVFAWTLIPSLMSFYECITWATMDDAKWHEKYEGGSNLDRGENN